MRVANRARPAIVKAMREEIARYERMREAIRLMRQKPAPASPAEAAAAVGLGLSRFEREFRALAGTTPTRFQGFLTKERARRILAESRDVLGASRETGLSSPGRLHDLTVTYEAVTPGELRSGQVDISYGVHPSPLGACLIGMTSRGICHLSFLDDPGAAETSLRASWPRARLLRRQRETAAVAREIFGGGDLSLALHVRGTNFQVKVWEALLCIPAGRVADYGTVARMAGSPLASRAAGTACGANPIAFLIPCHRVLAAGGGIGGYRWDTARKELLLAREASETGLAG